MERGQEPEDGRKEGRGHGPMERWQVSGEMGMPLPKGFCPVMVLWRKERTVALKSDVDGQGV